MSHAVRILALAVCLWSSSAAVGAERPSYSIARTGVPITIDGRLDEPSWVAAEQVGRFVFPWHEAGKREQTIAKLLWDDENLYVAYVCQDAHIWADQTERDSPVYQDDCVELFTAPDPSRPMVYYNIEMNVRGAFLDRYHPAGPGPEKSPWDAQGVAIATQVAGTLNDDGDLDAYWVLEAAIPFANFADTAVHTPPAARDEWRLNLNRLGGKTNAQHSQWSPGDTPRPSFHNPSAFGRVIFSDECVPFDE